MNDVTPTWLFNNLFSREAGAVEITFRDLDWEPVKKIAQAISTITGNEVSSFGKSIFIEFAEDYECLIRVIARTRLKSNVYVGVNPRKKIWLLSKSGKSYQSYRGTNSAVSAFNSVFIDIDCDREDEKKAATDDEIAAAKAVADDVDKVMAEVFGLRYRIRAFSGNGFQVFYPLNTVVFSPGVPYEKLGDEIVYTETEEFALFKNVAKYAVAPALRGVAQGRAKIDRTWDLRRVGRLPFTRNWKDPSDPRWCKVVDVCTDRSDDDAWLKMLRVAKTGTEYKLRGRKINKKVLTLKRWKKPQDMLKEPLVQILLQKRLPSGYRNHYLEMQLAILLRDHESTIDPKNLGSILADISRMQGRPFAASTDYLPKDAVFSEAVVNKWCMLEREPMLYEWEKPLDQAKLAEWKKHAYKSEVEEKYLEVCKNILNLESAPTLDTDEILERFRHPPKPTAFSPFVFVCFARSIVEKDDWPYWRDHVFCNLYAE